MPPQEPDVQYAYERSGQIEVIHSTNVIPLRSSNGRSSVTSNMNYHTLGRFTVHSKYFRYLCLWKQLWWND